MRGGVHESTGTTKREKLRECCKRKKERVRKDLRWVKQAKGLI